MRLNERELQKDFVKKLSKRLYPGLAFFEHPDQTERENEAIDVMAGLPDGTTLLIEHASISTFRDEQKRNRWFRTFRKTAEEYLPERIDGTRDKCFDLAIGSGKLKQGKQQEAFIRRLCDEIRDLAQELQRLEKGRDRTIPGASLSGNPHAPGVTIIARPGGNGELHLRLGDEQDRTDLAKRVTYLLSKKLAKLEQSRMGLCQTTRCETIMLLENTNIFHMNYDIMAEAVSRALAELARQSTAVRLPNSLWYAENTSTRNPPFYTLFKTAKTYFGNITITPVQLGELEEKQTTLTAGR